MNFQWQSLELIYQRRESIWPKVKIERLKETMSRGFCCPFCAKSLPSAFTRTQSAPVKL